MVPCVIVIRDNVVEENILCCDEEHADNVFLDKLAERISNWDEYSQDDIEAVLDNGHEKFGNGSVCMSWASSPDEVEDFIQTAIENLTEFYPDITHKEVVAAIRAKVTVPDTGNAQKDYEAVRDQVECIAVACCCQGKIY
jgi:hypothetical protein